MKAIGKEGPDGFVANVKSSLSLQTFSTAINSEQGEALIERIADNGKRDQRRLQKKNGGE